MDEDNLFEQFLERLREVSIKRDWPIRVEQNNGSLNIKEIAGASVEESPKSEEAVKADEINDSEECNKPAPFAVPTQIESAQSERGLDLHPKDQQSKPSDSSSSKASSQETMKPSVQEGSKLDEELRPNQIMDLELSKPLPTAFVVPSENESPHDNLVWEEGKGKRVTLDKKELPKTEPDNTEASIGECIESEKYDKASSSTSSDPKVSNVYPLKEPMDDREALAEIIIANETPNQRISSISISEKPQIETSAGQADLVDISQLDENISNFIESAQVPPISTNVKFQTVTSNIHTHPWSSKSNASDMSFDPTSPQGQIMVNQTETCIDDEIKDDYMVSKQIEEDDLIWLFRMMSEGADVEVDMPCIPKIASFEDDKVADAFADIESLLKMDLNQIANSEEHTHRLENALSFLSTHCSEINEPSTHGLRGKLESFRHETQNILSSFKLASSTLDTFIKHEERKNLIHEQHSQRMKAAIDLVSEISKADNRMAGLKEKISSLHAELNNKEKELKDCETKLSSLKEKKKKSVRDTIGFMEEYEAVKKEGSHMVDDQTRARKELEKVENQWPSCVANLKKTTFLLGSLYSRKL
ncbi:uncharacterized protein LOC129285715 isoform X2 [Prosopis cineraria]|uniref:uncharacterized protein LOC129285715 isoform X2 n=1 Tax=Prosopis cineraria TaxID=364024 RepID=UPI00240EDF4A|nr:uncharacterized protein LOC129285715 isoform X2 [Prosopis cineraria]